MPADKRIQNPELRTAAAAVGREIGNNILHELPSKNFARALTGVATAAAIGVGASFWTMNATIARVESALDSIVRDIKRNDDRILYLERRERGDIVGPFQAGRLD